jgi:hypothetical protein
LRASVILDISLPGSKILGPNQRVLVIARATCESEE